ncbi:unnamed protein product [Urochloa humidicola]
MRPAVGSARAPLWTAASVELRQPPLPCRGSERRAAPSPPQAGDAPGATPPTTRSSSCPRRYRIGDPLPQPGQARARLAASIRSSRAPRSARLDGGRRRVVERRGKAGEVTHGGAGELTRGGAGRARARRLILYQPPPRAPPASFVLLAFLAGRHPPRRLLILSLSLGPPPSLCGATAERGVGAARPPAAGERRPSPRLGRAAARPSGRQPRRQAWAGGASRPQRPARGSRPRGRDGQQRG